MAPVWDERQHILLKRKLQALNYTDHLDVSSCELVQCVVNDLIRTTESYRELKQHGDRQQQEIAAFRSKAEGAKRDTGRLIQENNQLHQQLIHAAEAGDQQRSQHYQQVKELEGEIAELSFWKNQAQARFERSEGEVTALKERLEELLKLEDGPTADTPGVSHEQVDVLEAVESRTEAEKDFYAGRARGSSFRLELVQREVTEKETELARVHNELDLLRLSVQHRDEEIQRLSDRVSQGTETDFANLSIRNETNEGIILTLNQQVDALSAELAQVRAEADELPMLRRSLEKATKDATEADNKLHAAVSDNQQIQEQVVKLKVEVTRMKTETSRSQKLGKAEGRGVLEQVSNLQGALEDANGGREQLRMKAHNAETQRAAAQRREAQLQIEMTAVQTKLEIADEEVEKLRAELAAVTASAAEGQAVQEQSALKCTAAEHQRDAATRREAELRGELAAVKLTLETAEVERAALNDQLGAIRGAQSESTRGNSALQNQLKEVTAEKQRLAAKLSSLEDDRSMLQQQLQEAVRSRTAAQAQQAHFEADKERLLREQASTSSRLEAASRQLDAAAADRDAFELEASKAKRELALVQEERTVLQEDLMRSRKQWQEHRERLATTEGELGHLSAIRDKSENLQAEMRGALARLSAAEDDARRARSDAERWRTAAGEAEDKGMALQASAREAERRAAEHKRAAADLQVELTSLAGRLQAAESASASLQEERERARALVELREEALTAERTKCQELAFQLRSVEHRQDSEKQRGTVKEEEALRAKAMLDDAQRSVEAWQDKHREAQAELRVLADKARQATALADEYQHDLDVARGQLEDERRLVASLQEQVSRAKGELMSTRSDAEQLKSLAVAGDRTHSDLEGRLASQAAELRAAQLRAQHLQDDLQQRLELYEEAKLEHGSAQSLVRQLDGERDKLQAELEGTAERLAALESEHAAARARVGELEAAVAGLEQRLVRSDRHAAQLEAELEAGAARDGVSRQNLVSLQQDYERLQEENVALSEDLAVMVKENQLVSGQLGHAAQQADDLRDELHRAQSAGGVLTQTLKARELELEDMRVAYEDLAVEDRQHVSSIGQMKRQLGGHGVELEAARQEVAHLQEAQRSAQLQMQQYVVDIQALERNGDALARELQAAKSEAEDIARDRNRVVEQLQAAQGIRYETERSRDALQREVASLDSQLHIANARLNETHAEVRALMGKHSLQQNRTQELEQLLEAMRAQHFSSTHMLTGPEPSGHVRTLQEKSQLLEAQVSDLNLQLQATKERNAVLQHQISSPSTPLPHSEAAADPHTVTELHTRCQHLDAQLEEARRRAKTAEDELAIAQRQLERLRETMCPGGSSVNLGQVVQENEQLRVRLHQLEQQIVDLEEQLSQAAKQAAAMQMDRERLLSMVSRLELDKRRLEAGGSATATASPTDSATPQRGRSRSEDAELAAKVNALESEKQALSDNVGSLQRMLSSLQRPTQRSGPDAAFSDGPWTPR